MTRTYLEPLKRALFVSSIIFFIGSAAYADGKKKPNTAAQKEAETQARRRFLFNLGFNDIPATIRERLERRQYHTELNRRQMVANMVSYEVVNASRELALLIFSKVDLNSQQGSDLALFIAKMLALKPLAPAIDYPSHIMNMKEGEERDLALVSWLNQERRAQMEKHKDRLVSDIASLLYGKEISDSKTQAEIRRIDKLATTIIDRLYMDDLIGSGKYFGRALAALLVRETKFDPELNKLRRLLSEELLARYNMYLENFIGDTLVIPSQKGIQVVKVQNGTMLLTRNLSSGSLQISYAAIPENLWDRWKARFKGIIGTPLATPLYVTPEDTEDGITLWMRIRDRIAQGGILRMGYSHIVYFQVKVDRGTGIKMARVIDNYPNRVYDSTGEYVRTGGTRFTYPEQVIDTSHHAAVYIANPVPEKVQDWSQKSYREFGYQPEFFPSIELELDELEPLKNNRITNWKTAITKTEYRKLHSETDAKKLSNKIWRRFADGLEQSVYDGWSFHWPDPYDFYLVGSTYCSQLGDMVMRKYVGMGLEERESVWHWSLRFLANVGRVGQSLKKVPALKAVGEYLLKLPNVEKSMKLTGVKIISPTTLVVQPYMDGKSYKLESKSPEQRVQSTYAIGDYREKDPRLSIKLNELLPENTFQYKSIDPILNYGAAMRDIEYGMVMRASYGLETHGFSAERIASAGSQAGLEGILNDWRKVGYQDASPKFLKNCEDIVAKK